MDIGGAIEGEMEGREDEEEEDEVFVSAEPAPALPEAPAAERLSRPECREQLLRVQLLYRQRSIELSAFLRRGSDDHPVRPVDAGLRGRALGNPLGHGGLLQSVGAQTVSVGGEQRRQPGRARIAADHREFHGHHLRPILCGGRPEGEARRDLRTCISRGNVLQFLQY